MTDTSVISISVTDQSARGCGWVFHVETNIFGDDYREEIYGRGGSNSREAAEKAGQEWVLAFLARTLLAFSNNTAAEACA